MEVEYPELPEQEYNESIGPAGKVCNKYDPVAEKDVIDWINGVLGEHISPGKDNLQAALKSGVILCRLVDKIYQNSSNLPPAARNVQLPIKFNNSNVPFKQMENIEIFIHNAELYGVPRTSLFQTVDLYEATNMAIVVYCILQLGTECQRNGFSGPVVGPKPTHENPRSFTDRQLNSHKKVIGLQAGTNKFASQKGMSFGAVRHSADGTTALPRITHAAHGTIGLQMGSNKGASQSGMCLGAQRHITDVGGRYVDFSPRRGSGVALEEANAETETETQQQ